MYIKLLEVKNMNIGNCFENGQIGTISEVMKSEDKNFN